MPTGVQSTSTSHGGTASVPSQGSATACTDVLASRMPTSSFRLGALRLAMVTRLAPARASSTATARAAPPAPRMTTSRPAGSMPSSRMDQTKPEPSVLEPMRRPSGWRTMVLTAPLISDDGSSPSSSGMTATLCGMVQLSPPKPEDTRSLDGGRQVLRGDPDVEVAPVESGVLEGGVLHDRGGVALDGIAEDGDVLGGHGCVPLARS